ncbi:MAG: hypothetical protein P1P88_01180 [Bacteroidales bacterium]|nr:hypothetical protein [Bacteroidales bacterium]
MNEVQLNPGNPRDAVQIIDTLTQDVQLKRREANIFQHCLHTLSEYVMMQSKKPDEPKKPEPKKTDKTKKPEPKKPQSRDINIKK